MHFGCQIDTWMNFGIFVGHQLRWKDHLDFRCHAVRVYGWMYGGYSSTKMVNLRFSNENAMTDFVELGMWVVVDTSTSHVSFVTECT